MTLNINKSSYLNLAAGARARLAVLKNAAAYTNAKDVNLPPSLVHADWRAARVSTFRNVFPSLSQGFNDTGASIGPKTPVWYCHDGAQFRNERYADNIARMRHSGWYSDCDMEETIRGIVGMLTHGRFIAGYECSENGERVYFDAVYTDETEAAHAADEHARVQAESEKEYSERYRDASNLRDDIADHESAIAELFPLRNQSRRVRADVYSNLAKLRTKRASLANDYDDIEF